MLIDELYSTALLHAVAEPVTCQICFTMKDTLDEVQLFRECRHSYCKECIRQFAEVTIRDGSIERLICPAYNETNNKPCTAYIQEFDLKAVGVEEELITKVTKISITRAIDQMSDFSWCPKTTCQSPAEIDEERNLGKCTECMFKFCTQCKSKFHPFKRCEKATVHFGTNEADIMKAKHNIEEKLNLLYIQKCSKTCPNCNFPIQKTDGCNKMKCQNCGTAFCWSCNTILCTVNPYLHF